MRSLYIALLISVGLNAQTFNFKCLTERELMMNFGENSDLWNVRMYSGVGYDEVTLDEQFDGSSFRIYRFARITYRADNTWGSMELSYGSWGVKKRFYRGSHHDSFNWVYWDASDIDETFNMINSYFDRVEAFESVVTPIANENDYTLRIGDHYYFKNNSPQVDFWGGNAEFYGLRVQGVEGDSERPEVRFHLNEEGRLYVSCEGNNYCYNTLEELTIAAFNYAETGIIN